MTDHNKGFSLEKVNCFFQNNAVLTITSNSTSVRVTEFIDLFHEINVT